MKTRMGKYQGIIWKYLSAGILLCLMLPAFTDSPADSRDTIQTGTVQEIAAGFQFTEGPLWLEKEKTLIFSDIPADTIYRLDHSIFRRPSHKANGLALDPQGCLIACEHETRRVTRTEADGTIHVLAERYEGKRLNSPNDVAIRSDGTIFFTDPPYGLGSRKQELDFCGLFAISSTGKLRLLACDFRKPNGLALSPDESCLYVADTDAGWIRVFKLDSEGNIHQGRVLCQVPNPDGLKTDSLGRLWVAAGDGVRVYTPQGALLKTIVFPQVPANCAFGGENGDILYVTARTAVYAVPCTGPGQAASHAANQERKSK